MIRAATLVAVLVTGAAAQAAAPAAGPQVSILYGSVTPVETQAVAGETVHWSNDSVRDHTVTADDGAYDSGTLGPNQHFDELFDATGSYSYHCRLHPYIRGKIDVYTLLLDRPSQPAASGRPYPLTGRAALPGDTPVSIQFDDGSGDWRELKQTTTNADGSFAAQVLPTASGSYRAVAGADQSPPVDLLVLDRTVSATVRGGRVSVTVTPASPRATVVLQLYLKNRFGWWPVAKQRLDGRSQASFVQRVRRSVSARVVLTLPDGATVIGASPKVRLQPRGTARA